MQRYRRVHTLSLLWFSSILNFFHESKAIKLTNLGLGVGHFKENEFYPEYSIIGSEVGLGVPTAQVFYHYVRRVEKYTFSILSQSSFFCWNVLESFINEFLPEMDVYKESKLGQQNNFLVYRRRGRCLEFVRCRSFKTGRSTWRRDPYPFTISAGYQSFKAIYPRQVETYFRMFRLPVLIHRNINQWWLARRWWPSQDKKI